MGFITVLIVAITAIAFTVPHKNFLKTDTETALPPLPALDSAMTIDLACAVIEAGASVPSTLIALDKALAEEKEQAGLGRVAHLLLMGASWSEAWEGTQERFVPLRDSLAPAWLSGAAPVPLLKRSADSIRQSRARRAREAASELGAKLVLPLGLCFLPAFVLFSVIPVVFSTGLSLFSP
ncbi:MAG: type II secretion system F family protein [Actinomycetaceae bacterium]|nr:type II secretion system F family protein [Actinomycetaceae bacterium]